MEFPFGKAVAHVKAGPPAHVFSSSEARALGGDVGRMVESVSSPSPTEISGLLRRGSAWLFIGNVISRAAGFLSGVIAARILTPKDFGLMALCSTFSTLVQLLGNLGVGQFLVHQRDDIHEFCVAAFWMNVVAGIGLFLIQVAAAPLVARFYGDALLQWLMVAMALGSLFGPVGSVQAALLQREMRFPVIAVRDVLMSLLGSCLVIAALLAGFGVWSLVVPGLIVALATSLANWRLHTWRPEVRGNFDRWAVIFRYGRFILGDSLLAFVINNADNMIGGKLLGPSRLGIYSFAYQRNTIVPDYLVSPITVATFPAFAALQENRETLRDLYLRVLKISGLIAFPAVFLHFALAQEFVVGIYGPKWADAVTPLRLLLAFALSKALCVNLPGLLAAVGRPDVGFKFAVSALPLLVGAILVGAHYGVNGLAAATGFVIGGTGPVLNWIVFSVLGWNFRRFFTSSFPGLAAALPMVVIVLIFRGALGYFADVSDVVTLGISGAVGAGIFLLLLSRVDPGAYGDLLGLLRRAVSRQAARDSAMGA